MGLQGKKPSCEADTRRTPEGQTLGPPPEPIGHMAHLHALTRRAYGRQAVNQGNEEPGKAWPSAPSAGSPTRLNSGSASAARVALPLRRSNLVNCQQMNQTPLLDLNPTPRRSALPPFSLINRDTCRGKSRLVVYPVGFTLLAGEF